MNQTAAKLPEYPIVLAMAGVGTTLGPQLIAEISDVSRFSHKGAQGKDYYVYMTAGANKFFRIYYGHVNEHLSSFTS